MVRVCKGFTMNNYCNFKRQVNLQNLTWMVVAECLWNQEDIKAMIQDFFSQNYYHSNYEKWLQLVTKKVLNNLNLIGLPEKLIHETEIQDVTVCIGEKIFNWTIEVVKVLGMDIKYAQQICWTSYGTIDEGKIFDVYWSKNADLPSGLDGNLYGDCPSLIFLSWKYFNKCFIHNFLVKVGDETEFIYKDVKFKLKKEECNIFNFMALFVCFDVYRNRGIIEYKKIKEFDHETGKLFILSSASAVLPKSVEFFWNCLSASDQQKYLLLAAKSAVRKYSNHSLTWSRRNKFAEVLSFLLCKMMSEQKHRLYR